MTSPFPNPDTYLNHLTPDGAGQFELTRNVYLAVLGAAIWDVLVYIPDDIKIVRTGVTPATMCFVLSRVFALVHATIAAVIWTHPLAHCRAAILLAELFCLFSMTTSSFLFLKRIHAIYSDSRLVKWIFNFLWLTISADIAALFMGADARHLDGTNNCIVYKLDKFLSISEFLPAGFDSLVFFATSYKIAMDYSTLDARITWDTFVSGKALPRLSRAILQGGQQYYLIVFTFNMVSGALLCVTSLPVSYRMLLTIPSTALLASMACRVFRNLRDYEEHNVTRRTLPVVSSINVHGDAVPEFQKSERQARTAHSRISETAPAASRIDIIPTEDGSEEGSHSLHIDHGDGSV